MKFIIGTAQFCGKYGINSKKKKSNKCKLSKQNI